MAPATRDRSVFGAIQAGDRRDSENPAGPTKGGRWRTRPAGGGASRATCSRSSRSARRSRRARTSSAARAYGSILDLFPAAPTPPLRGRAPRALGDARRSRSRSTRSRRRREQRPDHPASHRFSRSRSCKSGRAREGFEASDGAGLALVSGGPLRRRRPDPARGPRPRRARRGCRPSRSEARRDPSALHAAGGTRGRAVAALRPQLGDRRERRRLPHPRREGRPRLLRAAGSSPSGGELYADVTTGYGPECFTIRGRREAARTRTRSRRTTTRAARWATAWASSRSSSTTARATSPSRSGRSSSWSTARSSTSARILEGDEPLTRRARARGRLFRIK